jgi:sugar/nucleoside kinase (ribokinase family)
MPKKPPARTISTRSAPPAGQAESAGANPQSYDLFVYGTVFFDVVFTGLPAPPARGTEVHASGMGSCPGGIANLAIAASRLGVRTSLSAAFGDDVYGDFCWSTLTEQEGVDLTYSRRFSDWHSPVTVSMVVERDRAMLTHMHPVPVPAGELPAVVPDARTGFAHLDAEPQQWYRDASGTGMLLFADTGWDQDEKWSPSLLDQLDGFYCFLPNSDEAMAYTRTDDPHDALHALADRVPVAVVTCGGQGALAVDSTTGEQEWVPSLPVNAHDPTGAGDVFGAGFVLGTLRGWPLRQRLAFANLCAALSVQYVGGSLAAPGWGDIIDWLARTQAKAADGSSHAAELAATYGFITDVLPSMGRISVRRARATLARASDAEAHRP